MTKIYQSSGHRERLRTRFLEAGIDGFLDYEVIELLLTLGTPRKDCKKVAKEIIKKFSGLRGVLDALPQDLQQIKGIGPRNLFGIKLFQAVSERYQKSELFKKNKLDSSETIVNYLKEKLGRERKEHLIVLSLDSTDNLINISNISTGILNSNLVHPREVFNEAILVHAAKVILAHNHPSGNSEPSEGDMIITSQLNDAGKILDIKLVDHIIISSNEFYSFKKHKLI